MPNMKAAYPDMGYLVHLVSFHFCLPTEILSNSLCHGNRPMVPDRSGGKADFGLML